MDEVSIVGVDLAKQVLQVHGAATDGQVLFRTKLSRAQFAKFIASLPPCMVAMEEFAMAHHWDCELSRLGHEVRLIPPIYVKPFVKRQKNDAADADAEAVTVAVAVAVAEAAQRPTMRTLAVKKADQQARPMLFRTRDLLVGQRTRLVNALRRHLAEHGSIMR